MLKLMHLQWWQTIAKELIPTTIIYLDELKLAILQVPALPMIPQIKLFGLQTMELIVETNCG